MPKSFLVSLLALVAALAVPLIPVGRVRAGAPVVAAPPTVRIVNPAETAAAPRVNHKKTDQMRGFSMRLVEPSEKGIESYLQAIDELADMGCTWIDLSIAAHQDNVRSEAIFLEKTNTPSDKDILRVLAKAKSRGMGVMLMPVVLLNNSGSKDWRGIINPPNWDTWFASYVQFITGMARIAQQGDVDIFVVGSELLSTESYRERWIGTIAEIKKVYKGKLTYSSNWDHYESVTFWDQLDYVGMNNYYELAKKPGVPVAELNKTWEPIKKNILDFAAKQKKPFMFTEVGWHNLVNTLSEPWNYVAEGPIDDNEQLHAFQSFVESWQNVPNQQFMGAFIWEWYPGGHYHDRGTYSLQGTPALEVVKKWFAAP